MAARVTGIVAVVLVGLALVPAGAHVFEMFAKLRLVPADYMIVQNIYRGWALFGFVIFAALAAIAAHAYMVRRARLRLALACTAFACIVLSLAVFFTWVFPANQATMNWTVMADDLDAVRRQWEYGHAASAGLTFAAFVAIVIAAAGGNCKERQP